MIRTYKQKRTPDIFGGDCWNIEQLRFDPEINSIVETVFCQSNGFIGIRGSFEEDSASDTLSCGTFITGLYDYQPGKTLMMKGKPVLPDKFYRAAKAINSSYISVSAGKECFCSNECEWQKRFLNLKNGELTRQAIWKLASGKKLKIIASRFLSHKSHDLFVIKYKLKSIDYDGDLNLESCLDSNVLSFYLGDNQWGDVQTKTDGENEISISAITLNSMIMCSATAKHQITALAQLVKKTIQNKGKIGTVFKIKLQKGQECILEKTIRLNLSSSQSIHQSNHENKNYDSLLHEEGEYWQQVWHDCDIEINGDNKAQQGIRFCINQLINSYTKGVNASVTAKGLTGEGYGQLCFWDSEIYLLPFFIYTNPELARQILMFRYRILEQARERARLLGYNGAIFPWMTINGEDNPAVWECILGEQHINAAIPYAIAHYVKATDDYDWFNKYGAEIVFETARFWASRVHFDNRKQKYVINQVTGPDEYMEMVNNNCYTNMMAAWVLRYAHDVYSEMLFQNSRPDFLNKIANTESSNWKNISEKMYIPFDSYSGIHPQDDTFLDLDQVDISTIPVSEFPLESNWPWPNVLKVNALKQPDVVLASFLLPENFTFQQKKANYEYYEPKTTHDSSLSPSIHSIVASQIGKPDDSYDYFIRAARLDLDYGNPSDGVHLANAGGAWMAIVFGFAGFHWDGKMACFSPTIVSCWNKYKFKIKIQSRLIGCEISQNAAIFTLLQGAPMELKINQQQILLKDMISTSVSLLKVSQIGGIHD